MDNAMRFPPIRSQEELDAERRSWPMNYPRFVFLASLLIAVLGMPR